MLQPTKDLAEAHYHDLKERPFFPRLTNYLSSAPVVAMVRFLSSTRVIYHFDGA
jgi:nucleoside diphosphate kinase